MDDKLGYGVDLWGTSTEAFSNESSFSNALLNTNSFDFLDLNTITKKIILCPGDLLVRDGHVDFYINETSVISWGRLHKDYLIPKSFYHNNYDNYYYSNDIEDNKIPYKTIIRIRR